MVGFCLVGLGFFLGGSRGTEDAGGIFHAIWISYCLGQVHLFSRFLSASKSHFDYCLFWRGGVKLDDCICISCSARKCLIAKTKTSICISWTHTSITKITSYPDFSKVMKMPAKQLEIRPCSSLQHRQLKIFQQQNSSFHCEAEGKNIQSPLVVFIFKESQEKSPRI